jgi:hypothetical protein
MKLPCGRCHKNPALQVENGCLEDSPIPERWEIDGSTYQRCPGTLILPESFEMLRAYFWLTRGFLPGGLPWDEQSNKLIEAFEVIDAETAMLNDNKQKSSNHRPDWNNDTSMPF